MTGAGCVSTVVKYLEALRIVDVLLKKETLAMMAEERLPEGPDDPTIAY